MLDYYTMSKAARERERGGKRPLRETDTLAEREKTARKKRGRKAGGGVVVRCGDQQLKERKKERKKEREQGETWEGKRAWTRRSLTHSPE